MIGAEGLVLQFFKPWSNDYLFFSSPNYSLTIYSLSSSSAIPWHHSVTLFPCLS